MALGGDRVNQYNNSDGLNRLSAVIHLSIIFINEICWQIASEQTTFHLAQNIIGNLAGTY